MSVVERGFDVREHEIIQRTTKKTRRAYVELRQDDADGDEMIVAANFFLSAHKHHDEESPRV